MANIAIIGGGISGLYTAWLLSSKHQLTIYESSSQVGGHSDTHILSQQSTSLPIDMGFIVFNRLNYPHFSRLLDLLGIESYETDMSFSVFDQASGISYCASQSWRELVGSYRTLCKSEFWKMLVGIKRFYQRAQSDYSSINENMTLAEYVKSAGYNDAFVRLHLAPMAAALWSSSYEGVKSYPMRYMLEFMQNHHMLQFRDRPKWLTVKGGSQKYVQALRGRIPADFRCNDAVIAVTRSMRSVCVRSENSTVEYDAVVFACHSDQALSVLKDPTPAERSVLSRIKYRNNSVLLHGDQSIMPKNKKAWGSWHVYLPKDAADHEQLCSVTYYMNRLQDIASDNDFFISLNQDKYINPNSIYAKRNFQHPVYTPDTIQAQQQWDRINEHRTFFAGAYWGWGFHEDGVRSAIRAAGKVNELF